MWPLPLSPGKLSLGCWNVLPVQSIFVYFGTSGVLVSLRTWLMIKALGHRVSTILLEGLETKGQAHWQSTMYTWLISSKNWPLKPGELPWLAILGAYCQPSLMGEVVFSVSLLGEINWKFHIWKLLGLCPHVSFPLGWL